jgi:hypothetical protein
MYHYVENAKSLHSAHTVYLCVLHDFHKKQRLFFYPALTELVFITETECVYCAVKTKIVIQIYLSLQRVKRLKEFLNWRTEDAGHANRLTAVSCWQTAIQRLVHVGVYPRSMVVNSYKLEYVIQIKNYKVSNEKKSILLNETQNWVNGSTH